MTSRPTKPPAGADSWDAFVSAHPRATLYHTWRWTEFAARVFGFPLHRLESYDADGRLDGVLPLIVQRSPIFGRRLVSLPFFNYGGPLGQTPAIETQLLADAVALARTQGVKTLEVRDGVERAGIATRLDKVTLELTLPATADALGKALGSKLRSQIRRSDRENAVVKFGGAELLPEFYSVFAATMRDLGTPVYPRRFFAELLAAVGADCTLVVVTLHGQPAAVALLTHFRGHTEIPWAASLHEQRKSSVNMRLYWECLKFCIERGDRVFDFGRSTKDAGTYSFKLQWGAQPRQLHWLYPLEAAGVEQGAVGGRFRELATRAWTKLPRPVATALGSVISPGLPW